MLVNSANLDLLFRGFSTAFNKGLSLAPSQYRDIAMVVPSSTGENQYGWLGETPNIREWLGDRVIHNLSAAGYTLKNKTFESTVGVKRVAMEDDQYGIYTPLFEKMGRDAALHPDTLVFGLLQSGFHEECYDGQPFFDADHPVETEDGTVSVSNVQTGSEPAWYLLDCSQPIRPLVYQERLKYDFQRKDQDSDENTFFRDEYLYGVRGRGNAGFGLWQLAFGSKADLTPANYAAARAAMQNMRGENGKKLGITPTHLVASPLLEAKARALIMASTLENGATNVWAGSANLILTPYLD